MIDCRPKWQQKHEDKVVMLGGYESDINIPVHQDTPTEKPLWIASLIGPAIIGLAILTAAKIRGKGLT